MKRLFLLLLGWCGLQAAPVDVPSEIAAVTVYADRARVTRSAEVPVPAGESVLRFSGLPADLDESSVQAAGSGDGALRILGLEIRESFLSEAASAKVRNLEGQLRAIKDSEAELGAQQGNLDERRRFLEAVRDGLARGQGKEGSAVAVADLKDLYAFYSSELDTLSTSLAAVAASRRELAPKKKVLEEELARLRGGSGRSQKDVLVSVRADKPVTARLELAYNMEDASWQPLYDARANSTTGRIDLSSYGVIRQETGEDWNNVKISLSTARPSVGATMPELDPWWLQVVQPMPVPAAAAAAPRSQDLRMNRLAEPEEAMAEMAQMVVVEEETAEIDSAGISTVFEIKTPATIPADGESHRVPIIVRPFEGVLEYVTTPKLDQLAYLRAKVVNSGDAPILGGEVNLFRDGDFVGVGTFRFIAQGAEFDFFLGVDDSVKVTRKVLEDKASEGGFLQKKKGVIRKYETTVENFKTRPIKITVLDQLPVSQDTTISVGGVRFSETPKKQEKDTGKLEWEFSVDPKQKKTLVGEFTVEWPADKTVGGL